jgi:hypothetical protein
VSLLLGSDAGSACASRMLTTFPSSFFQRTSHCRRCDRLHGNEPRYRRFGPTEAHVAPSTREGRRRRVNQDAFYRCKRGPEEDCSSRYPRRPLAHAAHTLPPWLGTMCSSGIASALQVHGVSPGRARPSVTRRTHAARVAPCVATSREQVRLCYLVRIALASSRLDLTIQARLRGSAGEACSGS